MSGGHRARCRADTEARDQSSTGLTSTMGVALSASRLRTRTLVPSIDTMVTRVEPDGIGPIGRAGAEHASFEIGRVVARMHPQHVATGPIQPGEHDHVGTGLEGTEALAHRVVEHQPRLGGSFVTLLGSRRRIDQRRLDPADGQQFI